MDRRQQKTREAIFEAFSEILTFKPFSRITVQEIIDAANVGRSTFYDHFATKDDLLKEMCIDIFSHIFSEELTSERTHDFSSLEKNNIDALVTHLLYHLQDNRKKISGMLNSASSELFLRFFKKYLNNFVAVYFIREGSLQQGKVPEDFLVNHITGSFIEALRWWFDQKNPCSPEELAEYFSAVIKPVLKLKI